VDYSDNPQELYYLLTNIQIDLLVSLEWHGMERTAKAELTGLKTLRHSRSFGCPRLLCFDGFC
jgi:hypothetical protein